MINGNKFLKAYQEIEETIKADFMLLRDVKIIALLGSVSKGEASQSWSDLDILMVFKSTASGDISLRTLQKIKNITEKVSLKYEFPISVLPHTENDFEKYVCFEYLVHYAQGSCTYPDKDTLRNMIKKILDKRRINEIVRKSYCVYHLRHIRFNLIRKYVSIKNSEAYSEEEFGKLLIDKIIKVTDLILNYHDIWPDTKYKVYLQAKNYTSLKVDTLREALELRENWAKITKQELEKFIPKGLTYIYEAIHSILKDYYPSTPEESMAQE